ncbi:MAG: hypothetical protein ACXV2C_01815 [Candidatus Bathyarchaeia archaeon]
MSSPRKVSQPQEQKHLKRHHRIPSISSSESADLEAEELHLVPINTPIRTQPVHKKQRTDFPHQQIKGKPGRRAVRWSDEEIMVRN